MKKSLVLALAAGCMMSATTALAAPGDFTFDGSVDFKYGSVNRPQDGNVGNAAHSKFANGYFSDLTLNGNLNLAKNLDAYARFTYQFMENSIKGTTYQNYISSDDNGALDAFGLKYSNAGYSYTLGSQALTIGSGLIYDNGFIGRHTLPYAAVVSKKVGATDLTAFYAKTNYQSGVDNDKFYGLQGSYAVNDKFTVGGMFTKVKYGNDNNYLTTGNGDSQNFYEVSAAYQIDPKLGFNTAYAKSNADEDNKAYIGTLSYKFDKNNKLGVSYYRVEDLANINDYNYAGLTTTPNANTKGVSVSYSAVLGKDATFSISRSMYTAIKDTAVTGDANDRVKTTAGVTVTF